MGHDTARDAVNKNKAKLLIFTSDASPRLFGEFERMESSVPALRISETIEQMHMALGYRAGVIAVTDENFARRILELIEQEENWYGDKN
jgi:ribosomal protein L7Ae-like RNA K-turn-binding protein